MTPATRPVLAALVAASIAAAPTFAAGPDRLAQASKPSPTLAPPKPALPVSLEQALYLIRSTLLTLNDANRSGNYTVLRDLAAPDFQSVNTAADLALAFVDLRRRKFDLHAVATSAPELTAAPAIDERGMLRLAGFFPTRPLQIRFELMFQNAAGQWHLFGITVHTPEAPAHKPAPTQGTPSKPGQ